MSVLGITDFSMWSWQTIIVSIFFVSLFIVLIIVMLRRNAATTADDDDDDGEAIDYNQLRGIADSSEEIE